METPTFGCDHAYEAGLVPVATTFMPSDLSPRPALVER